MLGALAQPLPASPLPGSVYSDNNPLPAYSDRGQTAANPRPDNAGLVSALPPEDRPETGPVKSLPEQFRRTIIEYRTKEPAGTIIIDTPHTYLYLVLDDGKAMYRAVVKGWFNHIQDAVPDFEQAQTISEQVGDLFRRYLVHGWRGEAYALYGDFAAAGKELRQCIVLGDQIGTSFHRGAFLAFGAGVRLHER